MDAGEFYLGKLAVPLLPNLDCPTNATYFDTVFADDQGTPTLNPKWWCLFEQRGNGVEWRHYEYFNESNESRSRRDLVLRFASTIGNWTITSLTGFPAKWVDQVFVGASGIEAVKGVMSRTVEDDQQGDTRHGTLVDAHTVASTHQHIYNFRLDLDVDGSQNSFVELTPKAVPVSNSLKKKCHGGRDQNI